MQQDYKIVKESVVIKRINRALDLYNFRLYVTRYPLPKNGGRNAIWKKMAKNSKYGDCYVLYYRTIYPIQVVDFVGTAKKLGCLRDNEVIEY